MAPERRRVACKECRQQKEAEAVCQVRCDAEPPRVCSRCRRLGLTCATTPNPHARQTKTQLWRELEQLKGQALMHASLEKQDHVAHSVVHLPDTQVAASAPVAATEIIADVGTELPLGQAGRTSDGFRISPSIPNDSATSPSAAEKIECLDGQDVDGRKIRDCFTTFFRQYWPIFPIIDRDLNADECLRLSPFLFWTIVLVGSRRYDRDPTLLVRLAPRIYSMALLSLESRSNPVQKIQALLILCVWPVPINTMYKDISSVLSGAAIQLAMQIGLHVLGPGQDFARELIQARHEQVVVRAQLWVRCVMVFHETSLRDGIPPMLVANAELSGPGSDKLLSEFPAELRDMISLHRIMVSSAVAIPKAVEEARYSSQRDLLTSLINLFDSQLVEILGRCGTGTTAVYVWSCRVHLLAFHFFENPGSSNLPAMMFIYSAACSFLEELITEDRRSEIIETCPAFLERTVVLSAFCILKIIRSPLSEHVNKDAGEKAYFDAILICRRGSLLSDDLGARSATILSQVWNSKSIFRRATGKVQSLGTRIRSRLSMSIVFDCFWWWKEEFAGQANPYRDPSTENQTAAGIPGTDSALEEHGYPQQASQQQAPADAFKAQQSNEDVFSFLEPLPDFDWAADLDLTDLN